LEYEVYTYDKGKVQVQICFSPTLNFQNAPEGLRYGISIDDEPLRFLHEQTRNNNRKNWEKWWLTIIIKTQLMNPDRRKACGEVVDG